MVSRWFVVPVLAFLFHGSLLAEGMEQRQFQVIKQLGELNGVALNCRFLQETQRMKKALVLALPKRRQYGEAFDQETNTAFLRFIEQKASCPREADFSLQVDAAIVELNAAFARQ